MRALIPMAPTAEQRLVFVHGAGHGAWCWYKVLDRLQRAGHSATAIDLSSAGIHTLDANEVTKLAVYSQPLVQLIQSVPDGEKVVLVGHSLGGLNLSYVMELFPEKLAAAIFVVASMYPAGSKAAELRHKLFDSNEEVTMASQYFHHDGSEAPTSAQLKKECVGDALYHLCPSEDVVLAQMLLKPSPVLPPSEMIINITPERYGRVPRFYIKTTQDKLITPERQNLYLEYNPPKQVLELPSDHSPFFSTPDALVEQLLSIVSTLS